MFRNMYRAAALDSDFYERAETDSSLDREALFVVLVANTLAAIGAWIGFGEVAGSGVVETIRDWADLGTFTAPSEGGLFFVVATSVALAVVGWIVWAATTGFVGSRVFGGTTDFGEMLRVLAYAQSPLVIGIVPWLGPVAGVWSLVASVIAIRQALGFNTGRALGSAIGGWLVWSLLQFGAAGIGGLLFQ